MSQPAKPELGTALLEWSTDNLVVTSAGFGPSNIVDTATSFDISMTFSGTGLVWSFARGAQAPYKIDYYAEALNDDANDKHLGTVSGSLTSAKASYSGADTQLTVAAGTLNPDIYKLTAVVQIGGAPFKMVGFLEGYSIEVYS